MTIYAVVSHRAGYSSVVRAATVDESKVEELCEEAEQFYHKCHGLPSCVPSLFWRSSGWYTGHIQVVELEDGVPR